MVRELHVVGLTRDGRHLVLSASVDGRGAYLLAADDRLHRALRGEPREADEAASSAVTALTPKDIQARLRAGSSIEQVAREAGLPAARIERYAGPVLSEREKVIAAVRGAVLVRPRLGRSQLPVGAAVQWHLDRTAHVRAGSISWTAYRRPDGVWVARLELVVRGRGKRAEWVCAAGQAQALDPYAAVLGYLEVRPQSAAAPGSGPGPASRPAAARSSRTGGRAAGGR